MEKQWNSREEYLAARRAYQEKLARIGEERKAYLAQQPKLSPEEAYQEFKKTYGHEEEEEIEANNLSDNLSIHRHLMELMNEEEDEPKVKKESVCGSTAISPANQQPADTEKISALEQSSVSKGTELSLAEDAANFTILRLEKQKEVSRNVSMI